MVTRGLLFARGADAAAGHNGDRPVLSGVPLALLPIANRPLIEHALDTLSETGLDEIAIVVDEEIAPEMRRRVDERPESWRLMWVERAPDQGLQEVASLVSGFVADEPCILHLGESVVRSPLAPLLDGGGEGTHDSLKLLSSERFERGVARPQLRLADPVQRFPADDEAAGIYVVGPGFVEAAEKPGPVSLNEAIGAAISRMAGQGGRHEVLELPSSWRFRPRSKSLLEGNRFALASLSAAPVEAEVRNTDIEGPVHIHPTAVLEDSVVRGPAVIGAGAQLKDAYIGPYSAIGDQVRVEGTEIEHSVVLTGARICHLGSRLEASIIGPQAHVFREFRLPRGLRLDVGRSAEISLS